MIKNKGKQAVVTCKIPTSLGIAPYTLKIYRNGILIFEGVLLKVLESSSVLVSVPCLYEEGDYLSSEVTDSCSSVTSDEIEIRANNDKMLELIPEVIAIEKGSITPIKTEEFKQQLKDRTSCTAKYGMSKNIS